MAIKESTLSLITSIAQGDWVRAVTSAGASRRVTVANLAKQIVEGYAGSSLAGATQSVKSAIDALNSKHKHKTTEATSNASGNIELDIPSASTFVTATAPSSIYLIIPFKAGTVWYGKVVTRVGTALTVTTNATVTAEIDYI